LQTVVTVMTDIVPQDMTTVMAAIETTEEIGTETETVMAEAGEVTTGLVTDTIVALAITKIHQNVLPTMKTTGAGTIEHQRIMDFDPPVVGPRVRKLTRNLAATVVVVERAGMA
jgi:hypothetical protein